MITQQKLKSSVIKAQRYRCFCGPWTPGRPGHSAGIMEEKVEALGTVISLLPLWTIGSYKCPSLGQEDRQTCPSDLGLSWEEHAQVCFPVCLHISSPGEQSLVLQGAGAAVPVWLPTSLGLRGSQLWSLQSDHLRSVKLVGSDLQAPISYRVPC